LEPEPVSKIPGPQVDWHAAPATPPPSDAAAEAAPMFRQLPRPAARPAPTQPGVWRWLAIAFLVMLAVATLVMFRDVIVTAFPGLAPLYASVGLFVHPAATPNG
jgi:hypothetical protein